MEALKRQALQLIRDLEPEQALDVLSADISAVCSWA